MFFMVVAKTDRGVLFFQVSLFQVLSLFSCTFIFECLASFLHLWWKLVKKIRNSRKLLVCFFEIRRISDWNWSFCGEYALTARDTEDSLGSIF